MHRRCTLLLVTLVSTASFAAVSAGPAAAGEQLTKKELQQEANQFCEVANTALGEAFAAVFEGLPENVELPSEAVEAAVDAGLPIFREVLDAVDRLDGPSAFEKKVDKMLDQYRAVADDIEDDPTLAFDEADIWVKPDKVAKRLGLDDCIQGDA